MKIAFLDLNHVTRGVHTNTVPLGCCLIATYLQKEVDIDLHIKIFKSVDKATQCFQKWKPDVIGLSNYVWNSTLSKRMCEIAKEKTQEFISEAKESFDDLKENASEMASEAAEHLADFAEDAKEEIKEVKEKSKGFFQRLFGK